MKVRIKLTIGISILVVVIWLTVFVAGRTYTTIQEEFQVLEGDVINTRILVSEMEKAAIEIGHWSMEYIRLPLTSARLSAVWFALLLNFSCSYFDTSKYGINS